MHIYHGVITAKMGNFIPRRVNYICPQIRVCSKFLFRIFYNKILIFLNSLKSKIDLKQTFNYKTLFPHTTEKKKSFFSVNRSVKIYKYTFKSKQNKYLIFYFYKTNKI